MLLRLIPGYCSIKTSNSRQTKKKITKSLLKLSEEAEETQDFNFGSTQTCTQHLREHKVVIAYFLSFIKHCTVTLFTYSVYYSTLFLFSVARVVRPMQCSLCLSPPQRGAPPCLPVLLWLIYRPQVCYTWQVFTVTG